MRGEHGIALVQVLVMSVVLILFATGVLQMIFGTHVLYSRVKVSEEDKSWAQACQAKAMEKWGGTPCSVPVNCNFTSDGGPNVTYSCSGGKATFTVP